tara:strand:+ start:5567 stop:6712 length:1146 start_codon:yes stop_codon:yes gene_type:complete
MKNKNIPFNSASIAGNELLYIKKAINKKHISGAGEYTYKCNKFLEKTFNLKKSILSTSCTHALEAVSFLLNIQPGDEIILPSYTFVSTANAFVLNGAKPVFVDIRRDTLNINENLIEPLITKKTKAIIPVHYAGVSCEMDKIVEIANKNNLLIIEDNAHGLFGKYKNKFLGTFGTFSTQSFHETKNITCGEGGALFINDAKYIKRAEIIFDKGTNRLDFLKKQVNKYSWIDIGSSYRLSDLLAAFLFGQLENSKKIQNKRKKIWKKYYSLLEKWALINNVLLPFIPSHCESSYHMFYLIMPNRKSRDKLINWLNKNKINSVFHYIPLHKSTMSKKFGWDRSKCPITIEISERIIRLPMFYNLKMKKIEYIVEKILMYQKFT